MNRIILFLAALLIALTANAYYAYMRITTIDDQPHYISAFGLTITTDGKYLHAVAADNKPLTLSLDSVASMELVGAIDSAESIETVPVGEVDAYNLDGMTIGHFNSLDEARQSLTEGVYIIKDKSGQTIKIKVGK